MKKLLLVMLIVNLTSCEKEDNFKNRTGLLRNYTGLDGCSWVIESKGEVFEITNFHEFSGQFKDSTEVTFSYAPSDNVASICMVGGGIKLLSIQPK